MKPTVKKDTDWSIRLNNDSSRKSLRVSSVKAGRVEFVVLRFPNITWALSKEDFLKHFEPTVEV
jgi:hypothetical protein